MMFQVLSNLDIINNNLDDLIYKLCLFYSLYIGPSATHSRLPFFISQETQDEIALKLLSSFADQSIHADIFDNVAVNALDCLYGRYFERFLSMKGISDPVALKATVKYKKKNLVPEFK